MRLRRPHLRDQEGVRLPPDADRAGAPPQPRTGKDDSLAADRIQVVEAYCDAYPEDVEARTQANDELRRQPAPGGQRA
jgi:hypothetical protein